jgi:putative transposase
MNNNAPSYRGYRFPSEIISHAVWLYHRFSLSFRDVEDLLAERGILVSYETIRQWCRKFGPEYARRLKRRQGRLGDAWHLDELFVNIRGQQHYLWRAVDQDGDVIDILVQPRRDRRAAERFFRKLLKGQGREPRRLVTDRLRSYAAAQRTVMPSVAHDTSQYANNRAEVSHEPTRQRERGMRRFKSVAQAQRFLSVHGITQNLFRVGRHLLRAANYRILRTRAFVVWNAVTCAS